MVTDHRSPAPLEQAPESEDKRAEPDQRPIRVHRRRWLIVLTTMAAATAAWAVAVPLLGVDLAVRSGPDTVRPIDGLPVTLVSLAAGLAGWLLLVVLEKMLAPTKARRVWRIIAAGVLVVSLLGPLAAANATSAAVLLGLHLLVGGVLLVALPGPVTGRRDTPTLARS